MKSISVKIWTTYYNFNYIYFFRNYFGIRNNYNSNKISSDNYNLRTEFNNIVNIVQKK